MPHRYFTTEIAQGKAAITGADAHHLSRVMRAKLGDTVILCDEHALEYTATITAFADECVECSVGEGVPSAAEPPVAVSILAGYPKQDKLEQIIKHGVELGAAEFVPFFSRYCVAAPKKEEQKNVRYNRIALEAAKQSGRGRIPNVAMPILNFGAVCRTFSQYDLVLLCYEGGGVPLRALLEEAVAGRGAQMPASAAQTLAPPQAGETAAAQTAAQPQQESNAAGQHAATPLRIALITGAEGGFSQEEVAAATEAGAHIIGLGPRILRCETAPLAALSAMMAFLGALE